MIWENAFLVCEMYIYVLGEIERQSLNYVMLGEKNWQETPKMLKEFFFRVEL